MGIVRRVASAQLMLAMLALVVMGGATVADVVLKYLFSQPIAGAYDLVESLLPVVIFHGLPAALLRRQNIAIDLVDSVAGPDRTRWLIAAGDVVMAVMLALFGWAMVTPALQSWEFGDRKLELGLPLAAIWAAAILGVAGCVLVSVALVLRRPAREA